MDALIAQIEVVSSLAIVAGVAYGSLKLGSITAQLIRISDDLKALTAALGQHETRLTILETIKEVQK